MEVEGSDQMLSKTLEITARGQSFPWSPYLKDNSSMIFITQDL